MSKTVDKSESEIISREYAKRYSQWVIPVDDIEKILQKLPREERQTHYRQLAEIVEKSAFRREIDEWKRRLTRVLAIEDTLTEVQKQGLRQTLVAVEDFAAKIKERSLRVEKMESLKPIRSRI